MQQDNSALEVTAVPFPPLPTLPASQPTQITIATLNMENYFDALDDTGDLAEPKPAPRRHQPTPAQTGLCPQRPARLPHPGRRPGSGKANAARGAGRRARTVRLPLHRHPPGKRRRARH
ncbi:MAG: hypothetical protein M5U34_24470 [Chloroflexi bacterium]|nr:hypothetical protein [Chloroflexota bacterium]